MTSNLQSMDWRRVYLAFVALVMLAPAIAMPFSSEVAWGLEDFLAAALLLGGAWVAGEIVGRLVARRPERIMLLAIVAIATLAIWAQLAVQF